MEILDPKDKQLKLGWKRDDQLVARALDGDKSAVRAILNGHNIVEFQAEEKPLPTIESPDN